MNNQPQARQGVHPAVIRARRVSDTIVLIVTFVVLLLLSSMYFLVGAVSGAQTAGALALAVFGAFIGGIAVAGVVLLVGMFLLRMQRQMVLGNCLQIEYSSYAWLRDWANEVAADLKLPRVEIMITQDPYINAYAFGFARPYTIVLHSGSVRYLTQEELKVVVVHEMGHIKYWHTNIMLYLMPFSAVPIVGQIVRWICGFWYRRAEWACDRLALAYMRDLELVKNALIKVHVGPDAAQYMNQTAREWLQYTAERPMNRLAQTFSSHPFLVRRLSHLDKYRHLAQ